MCMVCCTCVLPFEPHAKFARTKMDVRATGQHSEDSKMAVHICDVNVSRSRANPSESKKRSPSPSQPPGERLSGRGKGVGSQKRGPGINTLTFPIL